MPDLQPPSQKKNAFFDPRGSSRYVSLCLDDIICSGSLPIMGED
mgnify:CR=1 FL=1